MNSLHAFELVKKFITKIRKEKIKKTSSTLILNVDKFINKDEIEAIFYFDSTIKKLCKLEKIIYVCKIEDESVAFIKK